MISTSQGKSTNPGPDEHRERLNVLLQGRRPTPWGMGLGFSRGTVTRMAGGALPGPDLLAPLVHIERASLSWLVAGRGRPFLVEWFATDISAADYITALGDERWRVDVLSSPSGDVLIYSQPAACQVAGQMISYRMVEVVAGAFGPASARALAGTLGVASRRAISHAQWLDIVAGWHGNQGLVQGPHWSGPALVAEDPARYEVLRDPASTVLRGPADGAEQPSESELLEIYRHMGAPDQHRLLALARTLGELDAG